MKHGLKGLSRGAALGLACLLITTVHSVSYKGCWRHLCLQGTWRQSLPRKQPSKHRPSGLCSAGNGTSGLVLLGRRFPAELPCTPRTPSAAIGSADTQRAALGLGPGERLRKPGRGWRSVPGATLGMREEPTADGEKRVNSPREHLGASLAEPAIGSPAGLNAFWLVVKPNYHFPGATAVNIL